MSKVPYIAILPCYTANGQNCSQVLFSDGTSQIYPLSVKHFKKKMYYDLYIDPLATKHWASQFLHETKYIPIILDQDTIFLPFQMRQNVPHGDGCFGYVLANSIERVKGSTLYLHGGLTLTTLSPPTYIHKRQIDAKVLHSAYLTTRQFS